MATKTAVSNNGTKHRVSQKAELQTEDDYCETLTASSEDSPMRPSQRVRKAAAMTTKAYLNEVNDRLEAAHRHG